MSQNRMKLLPIDADPLESALAAAIEDAIKGYSLEQLKALLAEVKAERKGK